MMMQVWYGKCSGAVALGEGHDCGQCVGFC